MEPLIFSELLDMFSIADFVILIVDPYKVLYYRSRLLYNDLLRAIVVHYGRQTSV
jgi:hypothetical protein